jgi:cytidylate kinase
MNISLIGLSGTNGSGKDTLGAILAEDYSFLFISVTDLLRDEARRQNLPVEREILRRISSDWRKEAGLGVLVDKALKQYQAQTSGYKGLVISSLRNPGEADRVHELGGKVIWVDADTKLRYDRIQKNKDSRGRSGEDTISFEVFLEEEKAEMTSDSNDKTKLNMSAVKDKSDLIILNNFNDISELKSDLKPKLDLL